MISAGDRIAAAVSGGADSMALLIVLHELSERWGFSLIVAHLDHGIRGDDSRREAAFVQRHAERLGLPCIVERRDVPECKNAEGVSLQQAARTVRYRFYREVLERCGADKIALGHHADDQAETVLMRLIRGASVSGLQGIPPVRDDVFIRPLIAVPRRHVELYLKGRGIEWVADSSSHELQYTRNRIRHHLIPKLALEFNPQIREVLCRTAEHMQACADAVDRDISAAAERLCAVSGDEIRCPASALAQYRRGYRALVMRKILEKLRGHIRGIEHVHIEALCDLSERRGPAKTVQLPGGFEAVRQYGDIVFSYAHPPPADFCYTFETLPARAPVPECGMVITFTVAQRPGRPPGAGGRRECLSADAVTFPLVIRNWRPGDRFYPLGTGGSKKLKDFFSDKKVPPRIRRAIPLVVFGGRIALVCGYRIDERFKVGPDTERVLTVSCEDAGSSECPDAPDKGHD